MSQYDLYFNLKINVGHRDLYFMVQAFALYLEARLMYKLQYLDYESVWPKVGPEINISNSDLHFTVR